jgi:hypothetical protein
MSGASLAAQAVAEVRALHIFFAEWLDVSGRDRALDPDRMEQAFAPDFRMVAPSGALLARADVIARVIAARGSRGSYERPFRIRIDHAEAIEVGGGLVVVTYVERQEGGERPPMARRASALFREAVQTPGRVEWVHVHETWIEAEQANSSS